MCAGKGRASVAFCVIYTTNTNTSMNTEWVIIIIIHLCVRCTMYVHLGSSTSVCWSSAHRHLCIMCGCVCARIVSLMTKIIIINQLGGWMCNSFTIIICGFDVVVYKLCDVCAHKLDILRFAVIFHALKIDSRTVFRSLHWLCTHRRHTACGCGCILSLFWRRRFSICLP